MSLDLGAVNIRFGAPAERRTTAERLVAELCSSLPDALRDALAAHAGTGGVAIVPRLRISVRAPLGSLRGRELARRIADACLHAIVHESSTLAPSASDHAEGTADRTLRALEVLDGVRVDPATEAAAWLLALVRDERTVVRRASPYSDLEHLSSAAAFVAICARAGAREVLASLGTVWAYTLALRCTASEAQRLLAMLDDGSEPAASTWLLLKEFRDGLTQAAHASSLPDEFRGGTGGQRSPADATGAVLASELAKPLANDFASGARSEVLALLVAMRGVFESYPGSVAAAKALAAASITSAARDALKPPARDAIAAEDRPPPEPGSSESPFESACTGFWALLPHLTRRLRAFDEETARAVALVVAERLWGTTAGADPAIAAFTCEREPAALRSVPPGVRVDRLCVTVMRDFARTLLRFERARPSYVLRAMLAGPGLVWRTTGGWAATLPQSPVRIVLERAALLGDVAVPWSEPKLAFERDP